MGTIANVCITNKIENKTEKKQLSGYLVGVEVLKNNEKDVLKAIRVSFEWIKTLFTSLKDFEPIKNIIDLTKGGEDVLAFNEFGRSTLKIMHAISSGFKNGIISSISLIVRGALDLVWNFFKICKTLKSYKIFTFTSRFFVNLMAVGGICFTISSADKINNNTNELNRLLNSCSANQKDAYTLYYLYQLSKNIGTFAIGSMTVASALFGFVASTSLMLVLGTSILVSTISSSVLKESYQLQVK